MPLAMPTINAQPVARTGAARSTSTQTNYPTSIGGMFGGNTADGSVRSDFYIPGYDSQGNPNYNAGSNEVSKLNPFGGNDFTGSNILGAGGTLAGQLLSQVYASQPPVGSLDALLKLYQTQAGPSLASLQGNINILTGQIPQIEAAYGTQMGALQKDNSAALALLGLDKANTGIKQGANARQPAYINALRGLDLQALNQTAARDTRLTKGDYTARGAWNTPGLGRDLKDISDVLANRSAQVNTRANEAVLSADDERRMLNNEANSYGLKADQLRAQLEAGLARLGLDKTLSIGNILQGINSGNADVANLMRQVIDQALGTYMTGAQNGSLAELLELLGISGGTTSTTNPGYIGGGGFGGSGIS